VVVDQEQLNETKTVEVGVTRFQLIGGVSTMNFDPPSSVDQSAITVLADRSASIRGMYGVKSPVSQSADQKLII